MTRAIYAGSFDLLTTGHMWMIEQGVALFDKLVIGIGVNPDKKTMFTVDERQTMIFNSLGPLQNSCEICSFPGYLYKAAEEEGATHILRGVRNSADFEYERVIRNLNGDFNADLTTVFLVPPRELAEVSSSVVKGLIGPEGWEEIVKPFVPDAVFQRLING